MATDKRKIQEINAGSMADIAFLLLIFFLVATTMNVDTGLVRMLPPMPPDEKQQEDIKVKERNLFLVLISGSGNIMAGPAGKQEIIDLHQLKDRTKEFILNPMDDENLPEKADKEIELADGSKWVYPESQGVVSLQTTRDTGYQSYIMVQNIQRSTRRGRHAEIRLEIRRPSRREPQRSIKSRSAEDLGGRTA